MGMNIPRKVHSLNQTYCSGIVTMKSLDFCLKLYLLQGLTPLPPPPPNHHKKKEKDKILNLWENLYNPQISKYTNVIRI